MTDIPEMNTFATRGAQMFLRFTSEELARLVRFGTDTPVAQRQAGSSNPPDRK